MNWTITEVAMSVDPRGQEQHDPGEHEAEHDAADR